MRNGTIRLLAALLLLSLSLGLAGCANVDDIRPKNSVFYEYFDTVGVFYDYTGGSDEDFSAAAKLVKSELEIYHKLYDIYNEYDGMNNIATVNRMAGKGPVKVDERIIDMLLFAKEMHELTDGNINVAMGAVLSLWHDEREAAALDPSAAKLPDPEALARAAEHTDINDMIIDEAELTVELLDPFMRLDVGAVGKGYAVEEVAKTLHGAYGDHYLIDVGGNIRAIGSKKSGAPYTTGIRNPIEGSENRFLKVLELRNAAAVTSGSYERFYTVDGKNYHHIINKDTLMPSDIYISLTVVSPSSALSDALSTALFNMPPEQMQELVSTLEGVSVTALLKDGTLIP